LVNSADLLRILNERRRRDYDYGSGRVFSSMCTKPFRTASRAYLEFLETNLLDEEIFPSAKALEEEAIKKIAELFSDPGATGYITSGGTEGNIVALLVARKLSRRKNVLAPASAHYSIHRACDLQQLRLVRSKLNDHRAGVDDIQEKADRDTIAIVATAGTTALGVVDPIEEIAEIAEDCGCFLHIDAAFGGFVLPFLENPPRWDFDVAGVSSIVADPHKMGSVPIPAGSVLFRHAEWSKALELEVPYLNKKSTTLLGSRPGASAAAVWAAIHSLGWDGYRKMIKRCMTLTKKLANGIERIEGLDLLVEPETNIVAFDSDTVDLHQLKGTLQARGWLVSLNRQPRSIRLLVMPHHERKHIADFLNNLKGCMEDLA
jgi:tyrosine decarboxylase/aspartate 1-decarboxylase